MICGNKWTITPLADARGTGRDNGAEGRRGGEAEGRKGGRAERRRGGSKDCESLRKKHPNGTTEQRRKTFAEKGQGIKAQI